jgi:hypothetical protein
VHAEEDDVEVRLPERADAAIGPTRCEPADHTTFWSVRGFACGTSAIRIEFVTIVTPSTAHSAWANAHVVVPADSPTAVPGETSSAIASVSDCWQRSEYSLLA